MVPGKGKATIKKTAKDALTIKPLRKTQKLSSAPTEAVKQLRPERYSSIMYIGHLPPGLLEDELKEFFEQFGDVKRVYVARSKRTNRSRGYGFVQFLYQEVASVAANAVNNYLLFGRTLRASVVPERHSKVPRNLLKGLEKNGAPKVDHFDTMKKRATFTNGFVGNERLSNLRQRQYKKVQQAMNELQEANVKLPDVPECYVKVTDVWQTKQNDNANSSEGEKEASTVVQSSDSVEFDKETNETNAQRPIEKAKKAIEKANAKANISKKRSVAQTQEAAKMKAPQKKTKRSANRNESSSIHQEG